MKTTLREIVSADPCVESICDLLNDLGHKCTGTPSSPDYWQSVYSVLPLSTQTRPIDYQYIMASSGIDDVFWCLTHINQDNEILFCVDLIDKLLNTTNIAMTSVIRDLVLSVGNYINKKISACQLENIWLAAIVAADKFDNYNTAANLDFTAATVREACGNILCHKLPSAINLIRSLVLEIMIFCDTADLSYGISISLTKKYIK